jgi:hypothetical protein
MHIIFWALFFNYMETLVTAFLRGISDFLFKLATKMLLLLCLEISELSMLPYCSQLFLVNNYWNYCSYAEPQRSEDYIGMQRGQARFFT